ncbi:GGDEF domain-containing protein [uncultured Ferrimonas sp.]|uniref:GGDEF domain-containing protein n=1 Tax=uncultured Ferrimonas sp. TaxID=432640 RepID=UPI0026276173|nr:GGDEF domain-containing protein [uncultured Ferrimonas sp.]
MFDRHRCYNNVSYLLAGIMACFIATYVVIDNLWQADYPNAFVLMMLASVGLWLVYQLLHHRSSLRSKLSFIAAISLVVLDAQVIYPNAQEARIWMLLLLCTSYTTLPLRWAFLTSLCCCGGFYAVVWARPQPEDLALSGGFGLMLLALWGSLHLFNYQTSSLLKQFRTQSITDDLTGLLKRGELERRYFEHNQGRRRDDECLCLLVIDLDDFKLVNDRHGHLEGDRALQWLAQCMLNVVRESDVAARVGGDEFCLLCPNLSESQGRQLALSLQQKVAHGALLAGLQAPLQISIGIAAGRCGQYDFSELFACADARLYQAKAQRSAAAVA